MENHKINSIILRKDFREDEFNKYSYELTVRKGLETASFRIPLYSVGVTMTDAYGNDTETVLTDAFSDEGKAIRFYEFVLRNLATPLNLSFILEDEAIH